jgi:5-methylcytosine-specific restriction endonuclease McrA
MKHWDHNVLVQNPHPQSMAALVLLCRKYYPFPNYKKWLKYRKHILRKIYRTAKELRCHYCDKGPLRMHSRKHGDPSHATLDHVKPVSKGGERYSSSNIVIACWSCNKRKADMDVEAFINPIV